MTAVLYAVTNYCCKLQLKSPTAPAAFRRGTVLCNAGTAAERAIMSCAGGVDKLGVTGSARRGQPSLRRRGLPVVICFLQILRCCSSAGLGGDGPTGLRWPPLMQGAAGLLLENYRDELEATIPSSLIDAHQVTARLLSRVMGLGFLCIPPNLQSPAAVLA